MTFVLLAFGTICIRSGISGSSGSDVLSSQQNSEEQVQGNSGPKQHAHRLSRDDRFRRNAHIRRDEAAGSSL